MDEERLRRTPLYEVHRELGARMVGFGGWEMPVQYSSIVEEHQAVRKTAGLFDVSHMGEFEFKGNRAQSLVQHLTANDVEKLGVGRGQYSMFLNERGGAVDDIIVYRTGEQVYLIVVNAGNTEKDWAHVASVSASFDGVEVSDRSADYALLALQGPRAEDILSRLTEYDLGKIRYYRVRAAHVAGHAVRIARTGYTGEPGFEIFVAPENAADLWGLLLAAGEPEGLLPAGLGARDTLRIEASLPLYGHELDEDTSPIEAGLEGFVSDGDGYIGAEAIRKQRREGVRKRLVMLEMVERGFPRQGYAVQNAGGDPVGTVTSGSVAPWLGKQIAMAYVTPEASEEGRQLQVVIRNRSLKAVVVPRPFYNRPRDL